MRNRVNYIHAWRSNRRVRLDTTESRKGHKNGDRSTLSVVINVLNVWQGRGPKQKLISQLNHISGRRHDKRCGKFSHHQTKGVEKVIRGRGGGITRSRKDEREEPIWQRTRNQRFRCASMTESRGKSGIQGKGTAEDHNPVQGRVEIEIESSEEMDYSQSKGNRGKRNEKGQCSRNLQQGRENENQKRQRKRGRGVIDIFVPHSMEHEMSII